MLNGLKSSVTIAQTPFDDRGAIDLESVDTLTDFYLKHGVDGFVVLGVSGEGPRLAPEEALQVASRFIARQWKAGDRWRQQSEFGAVADDDG